MNKVVGCMVARTFACVPVQYVVQIEAVFAFWRHKQYTKSCSLHGAHRACGRGLF